MKIKFVSRTGRLLAFTWNLQTTTSAREKVRVLSILHTLGQEKAQQCTVVMQPAPLLSAQFAHLKQQVFSFIAHVLVLTSADNSNLCALLSHGKKKLIKKN